MGTLKDAVDLVTSLMNTVKDRRYVAELREVHSIIGDSISRQAELQTQNADLIQENNKLRQANSELERQLESNESQSIIQNDSEINSEEIVLEENTILVLKFISEVKYATTFEVARNLSCKEIKIQYILDRLRDIELVHSLLSISSPPRYGLTEKGRAYLVENDLV